MDTMQRRTYLTAVSAAVVGLTGCVGAARYVDERVADSDGTVTTTDDGTVTTAVPADELIEIRDGAFQPRVANVPAGSLVRWANHDGHEHAIQSAQFHDAATTWEFSSGVLGDGDIVTHRFEEPGVYEYYCSIRGKGTTCGAVLVGDVELPGSLPCE